MESQQTDVAGRPWMSIYLARSRKSFRWALALKLNLLKIFMNGRLRQTNRTLSFWTIKRDYREWTIPKLERINPWQTIPGNSLNIGRFPVWSLIWRRSSDYFCDTVIDAEVIWLITYAVKWENYNRWMNRHQPCGGTTLSDPDHQTWPVCHIGRIIFSDVFRTCLFTPFLRNALLELL